MMSVYPKLLEKALALGYISRAQAEKCSQSLKSGEALESLLIKHDYLSLEQLRNLIAACRHDQEMEKTRGESGGLRIGGLGPGAKVGLFTVIKLLGTGGMGAVYLAKQDFPAREVALKMLTKMSAINDAQVQRFLKEAEVGALLDHKNIVKTYMAGVCDDIPYLAISRIKGVTLDEYEKINRLGIEEKLSIVIAVARALDYAHNKGIIHRDIKPGNIMVTADGSPVVMDFGIARTIRHRDRKLTRTGTVLGTPQYMPPEQATGQKDIDARADVYSLGAVLYRLLAGRPPFDGDNSLQILYEVVSDKPKALREIDPNIPEQLENIAMRCLEKERARRYKSAGEFAEAIEKYLRGERTSDFKEGIRKSRWWLEAHAKKILCATMLFLTCAVFFWWSLKENPQRKDAIEIETQNCETAICRRFRTLREDAEKNPSSRHYRIYLDFLEKWGQYHHGVKIAAKAACWVEKNKPDEMGYFNAKKADFLYWAKRYRECCEVYRCLARPDNERRLNWASSAIALERYSNARKILGTLEINRLDDRQKKRRLLYLGACTLKEIVGEISAGKDCAETIASSDKLLRRAISRLDRAKTLFRQDRELQGQVLIYLYLAQGLCSGNRKRGKWALALAEIQPLERALVYRVQGIRALADKNYSKAIKNFSRCAQAAPWEKSAYFLRARAKVKSDCTIESVADDCFRAIQLDPTDLSPLDTYCRKMIKQPLPETFYRLRWLIPFFGNQCRSTMKPKPLRDRYLDFAKSCIEKSPRESAVSDEQLRDLLREMAQTSSAREFESGAELLRELGGDCRISIVSKRNGKKLRKLIKMGQNRRRLRFLLARTLVKHDLFARRKLRAEYEHLVAMLEDSREAPIFRLWAAEGLIAIGKPKAYQYLDHKESLKNLDAGRAFCCAALAKHGFIANFPDSLDIFELPVEAQSLLLHHFPGKFPISTCRKLLKFGKGETRYAAARAMLQNGWNFSEKTMKKLMEQATPGERIYICSWFWDIASEKSSGVARMLQSNVYPEFLRQQILNDQTGFVRQAACFSAGKLKMTELIDSMTSVIAQSNGRQRFFILNAIFDMKRMDVAFEYIQGNLDFPNRLTIGMRVLSRKNNLKAYSQGELHNKSLKLLLEKKNSPDDCVRFFLFHFAGCLLNSSLNKQEKIFLTAWLLRGIDSLDRINRLGAIYGITHGKPSNFYNALMKLFTVEKDPQCQQIAAGTTTYLILKMRDIRPKLEKKRLNNREVQRQPDPIQKGIAYGYSHLLEARIHELPEHISLDVADPWGRDRLYLMELQGAIQEICFEFYRQPLVNPEKINAFVENARGFPHLLYLAKQAKAQQKNTGKTKSKNDLLFRSMIASEVLELIHCLKKSQEIDPKNSLYYFQSALLCEFLGEYSQAQKDLQKALSIEPKRMLYLFLKARLLYRTGKSLEALQHIKQFGEEGKNYTTLELLGKIYMAIGKWDKAKNTFYRMQLIKPKIAAPLVLRGHIMVYRENLTAARSIYRLAWTLLQHDNEKAKRESDKRLAFFKRCELQSMRGQYYWGLAQIAAKQGKTGKSIDYLQKGSAAYRLNYFNYPYTPFTRENIKRYRKFDQAAKSDFVKSLPKKVIGLTEYR